MSVVEVLIPNSNSNNEAQLLYCLFVSEQTWPNTQETLLTTWKIVAFTATSVLLVLLLVILARMFQTKFKTHFLPRFVLFSFFFLRLRTLIQFLHSALLTEEMEQLMSLVDTFCCCSEQKSLSHRRGRSPPETHSSPFCN